MFEERKNFDRTRTVRLYFRRQVRKYEIEKAFENEAIEWANMKIYHHY